MGGTGDDFPRGGLALDAQDQVCVVGTSTSPNFTLVGSTSSDDFPVTDGAVQKQHGGKGDAFVVKLMPVLGQRP